MTAMRLQSERFAATGSIAGEGVRNTLGRPTTDPLLTMVREAVQNCWDARATPYGPIDVQFSAFTLSSDQLNAVRNEVLIETAPGLGLTEQLAAGGVSMLVVRDGRTVGLGGPTRADVPTAIEDPRDFVDFVRNVGEPPDRRFSSGGTYGYGKASFYGFSRVRTIVVYTRTKAPIGRLSSYPSESRFMAMAVGDRFQTDGPTGGRYTGRHWWGAMSPDGIVDPLTNSDADRMAEAVGIPAFELDGSGTAIGILVPYLDHGAGRHEMARLAEALVWQFWPKMVEIEGRPPAIEFDVEWNAERIELPKPDSYPPLDGFVHALRDLKSFDDGPGLRSHAEVLVPVERSGRRLGLLSLRTFPARSRPAHALGADNGLPIAGLSHHVALLRVPELVVKYMEGPEIASDLVEYGGVFLADPAVDPVFAESEPPTHDDWLPESLSDKDHRADVRAAVRAVRSELLELVRPADRTGEDDSAAALGGFAEYLGELFPGLGGPGAPAQLPIGTSMRGPASARVRIVGPPKLIDFDGLPAAAVTFDVIAAPGTAKTRVSARVAASIDDGQSETAPPDGSPVPSIMCWLGPDGDRYDGPFVDVAGTLDGVWQLVTSIVDDASVGVSISGTALTR